MTYSADKSSRMPRSGWQAVVSRRGHNAGPVADARANYERYITLARASEQIGGAVETENWLQHADHYFRMMRDPAS